jgi:hypothetical protein
MWCGECYNSHPTILFHVKQRESFDTKKATDQDQERVVKAWGNKHRAPDEYLVGSDGVRLLIPFKCDLCIYWKLRGNNPLGMSEKSCSWQPYKEYLRMHFEAGLNQQY